MHSFAILFLSCTWLRHRIGMQPSASKILQIVLLWGSTDLIISLKLARYICKFFGKVVAKPTMARNIFNF